MNDKVSIVVPVYNVKKYIRETVLSVMSQSYENWELILVDDVSTDGTREELETFKDSRVKVIYLNENRGAAHARNVGIRESDGRYLAFLDADDIWKEEKIKSQINFMKEKEIAFSFMNYEFGDEYANPSGHIVVVPESITYKQALKNTTIFTSTVMIDLAKLAKEQVMMPLIKSEDTATWWNILRDGVVGRGIRETLVIYRRPPKSLSSNKFAAIQRVWALYRKHEKFGHIKSACYFICWAFSAVKRRI